MTLLGKILRIHVDPTLGVASIPANNPFANSGTFRREIWALGLRNPFRNSFDRQTGNMFIGDVGQSAREEVDVQKASNPGGGENYGWRLREGTIATPGIGGPPPPGAVEPILITTDPSAERLSADTFIAVRRSPRCKANTCSVISGRKNLLARF